MRALWCVLLLVACGGPNALQGSVKPPEALDFNDLLLRKQGNDLLVQYQQRAGNSVEIVAKLAVAMDDFPQDRISRGDDFAQRASLSRAVLDNSQFPRLLHGTLHFDRLTFKHGGQLLADFDLLFVDQTTLHGQFSGTLVEVLVE